MNGLIDDLALSKKIFCLCRLVHLMQVSLEIHMLHNSKLVGLKIGLAFVCIGSVQDCKGEGALLCSYYAISLLIQYPPVWPVLYYPHSQT